VFRSGQGDGSAEENVSAMTIAGNFPRIKGIVRAKAAASLRKYVGVSIRAIELKADAGSVDPCIMVKVDCLFRFWFPAVENHV
jgi:hypothetical protein